MITQAFILGAGLGKRLRPLTDVLPKPLVPLFHKPLAEWAVGACEAVGCKRFAINTHHLPEKWRGFGDGRDISFFHEPVLLETGGGLKNIEPWIEDSSLLIHNGDIFSSMDLRKLVEAHEASGDEVTLALRSNGTAKHIAVDSEGKVTDIHRKLGRAEGSKVFSGIYCVRRDFLRRIPACEKISVIPFFLALVKEGKLGSVTLDSGKWMDLGDVESYLAAHRELALQEPVHPEAMIGEGAVIENSVIGNGAIIGKGARVVDCVVWPGAIVSGQLVGEVVTANPAAAMPFVTFSGVGMLPGVDSRSNVSQEDVMGS
jgi:mannose-1-phosphate guanylyltransferase